MCQLTSVWKARLKTTANNKRNNKKLSSYIGFDVVIFSREKRKRIAIAAHTATCYNEGIQALKLCQTKAHS